MKKFTRFAAAGVAVTAGLTLAACHPPSQQDSSEKVETAATFEGEAPGAGAAESSESADATDVVGTEAATETAVAPAEYTTAPVQQ
ncbi:hypothetical protein [Corynebacterium singulare]|uniref:Lipoprotein n=1 Tax=Corynebacterium singulare TaxID=161899 RepID=A0A0B6F041_9CORY|nr:hypothetical protein [Corynebacterium singulare]AJI78554.1 hypothetical protein CSING_05075 [Corynebacterium singulare]